MRAQALRDLHAVPTTLGFVSILATFFDIGSLADYMGGGATAALVGYALLILLVSGGLTMLILDLSSKPQQYYWRRLWVDRAASTSA